MSGADPHRPTPSRGRSIGQGSARPIWPAVAPHTHHAGRPGAPDEVHIDTLALDGFERLTLALMRFHFQTFAAPNTHGWLMALRCATAHLGARDAALLCYDLVALVQVLRSSRTSPFAYNPEGCTCCRVWLTPTERQLMEFLVALRNGRKGRAQALVQMLCDGRPSDDLIGVAQMYLHRHAPQDDAIAAAPAP